LCTIGLGESPVNKYGCHKGFSTTYVRLFPKRYPENALGIGYFGASTGAAAAVEASAALGSAIGAVVSRGGRPDLARHALVYVQAPTLLIVGGEDYQVLDLNQQAYTHLRGEKQLVIIPGASHLFEESGALQEVARLASQWFTRYLRAQPTENS
jgi:putative phosphoribosyl transferase